MDVTAGILTPERAALVERMAALGPRFAARAEAHDRDATFPTQNWSDLRDAGLLGLCIPVAEGGLGGDFAANSQMITLQTLR